MPMNYMGKERNYIYNIQEKGVIFLPEEEL